ncbi:MAG: hypothetical protein WDO73_38065 [Ignavibacteriota bacterium]
MIRKIRPCGSPSARLDVLGIDALAVVQAAQQRGNNFLGLVFAEILDEAVEKMFPGQGMIDLGFLIVIL